MNPRPSTPTGFEIEILREVAGEARPSPWGAAIGSALSWLHAQGYITSEFGGEPTEKGRKALQEARARDKAINEQLRDALEPGVIRHVRATLIEGLRKQHSTAATGGSGG